jgi:DNA modification methylase
MKANELRIGNLYNQFGNIHQVNGHIISELEKAPQGQLWCKPIPLTEEWLLKFGFEFKAEELGVKFYEKQVGIDFICFSKEGHWNINSGESYWYMDRNFKSPQFVHQLQNLYFALTNEELTIM